MEELRASSVVLPHHPWDFSLPDHGDVEITDSEVQTTISQRGSTIPTPRGKENLVLSSSLLVACRFWTGLLYFAFSHRSVVVSYPVSTERAIRPFARSYFICHLGNLVGKKAQWQYLTAKLTTYCIICARWYVRIVKSSPLCRISTQEAHLVNFARVASVHELPCRPARVVKWTTCLIGQAVGGFTRHSSSQNRIYLPETSLYQFETLLHKLCAFYL